MAAANKNIKEQQYHGWYWVLASVLLVSFAQLSMKYGVQLVDGDIDIESILALFDSHQWLRVVIPIMLGVIAYGISVLCWLFALARLPLSVSYPMLSLSYLLVYFGAVLLPYFNESISVMRLVGTALVIFGIVLVAVPTGPTGSNIASVHDE